ncbi:MAG TPA: glycosyltransferase family 39 protein [Steroidobacteraceae bacterium]|nr:glycosyltransferase family 39 protein [Steroidobacteraceae bacterium]
MSAARGNSGDGWLRALALLAAGCVLFGAFARFHGLGKWPLAIDEYYLEQSVLNVLRSGLPQYACGGLYVRGLALQYLAALLQFAGVGPELAPRLIAAVCSLVSLPAAYLLARRLGGRALGLAAVALLALSVWETELARFGRMYAPFQAVFLWYLVCFLAYTLDRSRRALLPMLLLSLLAVLVWEGGVFLALTNLLPPFLRTPSGRLSRADWKYLLGTALLCVPGYLLATANLRAGGDEPILPDDYQAPPEIHLSRLDAAAMPWTTLHLHPLWMLALALPLVLAVIAIVRLVRAGTSPLALLGCIAVLGCALLQQFALAAALLLVMAVLSIRSWRELMLPASMAFLVAIGACTLYWSLFGLGTHDWHASGLTPVRTVLLLGYQFVRVPDFVREVAVPWARTVPLLGLGLCVLLVVECARVIRAPGGTLLAERALLGLLLILLLAASASHPPRHETRYVFFLYPLAIVLALSAARWLVSTVSGNESTAGLGAAWLTIVAFTLSEDFRPVHLWNIDSAAVSFRLNASPAEIAHYQPRSDLRGAADWLTSHVDRASDIVINSFPGVDFYYPHSNFYWMDQSDVRFESWSCRRGRFERWSNLPLLHSPQALGTQIGTGRKVWIVMETSRLPALQASLGTVPWSVAWQGLTPDIAIVLVHATTHSSQEPGA